jgi:hypothetical protein
VFVKEFYNCSDVLTKLQTRNDHERKQNWLLNGYKEKEIAALISTGEFQYNDAIWGHVRFHNDA